MDHRSASSPESALFDVLEELKELYPPGDDYHNLIFHLIYERFVLANSSYWWPYLESIPDPDTLDVPLLYSSLNEDMQRNLEGSRLYDMINEYRTSVEERYHVVKSRVFEIYPQVFDVETHFTMRNYMWATAVLDSRSVWWNERQHLVPLLDLVNCEVSTSSSSLLDEELREEIPEKFLDVLSDSSIVVRARRSYESGESLREDYNLPNWYLFLHYGFVLPSVPSMTLVNPHDCFQTELILEDTLKDFERKQRELQRRGMYETSLQSCVAPEFVSSDVWIFLRVKNNIEDRDALGVRVALYEHLNFRKSSYKTTLEEDFDILSNANGHVFATNRQARTSIQFRFEEKKALRNVMDWLNKEIEKMGGVGGGGDEL